MNNVSAKETRCIEKSHETRLAAAKSRLADLKKNGIPFDSPVSGLAGGITWNESLGGKIKQIAILPLALLLVLLLIAMTPIAYIFYLWEVYQKRGELEREVQALETESLSDEVPDKKNVESMWRLHGLDEREYSLDEQLNLLDTWIGILYGEDVTKNLGLKQRVNEIAERRVMINLPYYQGEEGAAHFRLAPPVDSLVRQLSEEFPVYK